MPFLSECITYRKIHSQRSQSYGSWLLPVLVSFRNSTERENLSCEYITPTNYSWFRDYTVLGMLMESAVKMYMHSMQAITVPFSQTWTTRWSQYFFRWMLWYFTPARWLWGCAQLSYSHSNAHVTTIRDHFCSAESVSIHIEMTVFQQVS